MCSVRLFAVFMVFASACSSVDAANVTAGPSASPAWTPNPDHVIRAVPGTPAGVEPCRDNSEVEAVLRQFTAAFNSGDPLAIQAIVSPEFWALSVAGQVAYTRDDAIRLVVERQRAGDRLELRRVQVNSLVGWDGAAHFGPIDFALHRGSDTRLGSGKGALYCGGSVRGIKVLGTGT